MAMLLDGLTILAADASIVGENEIGNIPTAKCPAVP
jgi:hypothetical protein